MPRVHIALTTKEEKMLEALKEHGYAFPSDTIQGVYRKMLWDTYHKVIEEEKETEKKTE